MSINTWKKHTSYTNNTISLARVTFLNNVNVSLYVAYKCSLVSSQRRNIYDNGIG